MNGLLRFLRGLHERDERGSLADLRCALTKARRHRAWPLLAFFDGIGNRHPARVVQTVSGLYAHHPVETEVGNFGDTCRSLMSTDEAETYLQEQKPGPMSRRFQHLLAASRDEICERVVQLGLYAKSKEVPVNYEQLFNDLKYWSERVRIQWAERFWNPAPEEDGP